MPHDSKHQSRSEKLTREVNSSNLTFLMRQETKPTYLVSSTHATNLADLSITIQCVIIIRMR